MRFHARMTIEEALQAYSGCGDILFDHGITCIRCTGARQETIQRIAEVYGLDPGVIVEKLNLLLECLEDTGEGK